MSYTQPSPSANVQAEAVNIFSARAAMYAAESTPAKLIALEIRENVQYPVGTALSSVIGADVANPGISIRKTYASDSIPGGGNGLLLAKTIVGTVPVRGIEIETRLPHTATV